MNQTKHRQLLRQLRNKRFSFIDKEAVDRLLDDETTDTDQRRQRILKKQRETLTKQIADGVMQ